MRYDPFDDRFVPDDIPTLHRYLERRDVDAPFYDEFIPAWVEHDLGLKAEGYHNKNYFDLTESEKIRFKAWMTKLEPYLVESEDPHEIAPRAVLETNGLLPLDTWLVHFTDYPDVIAGQGFQYGEDFFSLVSGLWREHQDNNKGPFVLAYQATRENTEGEGSYAKINHSGALLLKANSAMAIRNILEDKDEVVFDRLKGVRDKIPLMLLSNGDWAILPKRNGLDPIFSGSIDKVTRFADANIGTRRSEIVYE